jgi:hypothetical protein
MIAWGKIGGGEESVEKPDVAAENERELPAGPQEIVKSLDRVDPEEIEL